MNNRRTHNRMTRMLMNNSLDWHTVDSINKRIDSPTFQDMVLSRIIGGNFALPLLPQVGHRKVNHDLFSAFSIGMQKGGYKGVQAAVYHHLEDIISNQLRNNFGTDGRDLIEAGFNYSFSRHRRHTAPRRY